MGGSDWTNFYVLTLFSQRNLALQVKCTFCRKTVIGHFAFLSTPLGGGGLQATYAVHFRLVEVVGKRVVDFLSVIIELFRKVSRLSCYERISIENRRFSRNGVRLAQNFSYKRSPTDHFSRRKTRMIALSYCIKMWSYISFVYHTSHV